MQAGHIHPTASERQRPVSASISSLLGSVRNDRPGPFRRHAWQITHSAFMWRDGTGHRSRRGVDSGAGRLRAPYLTRGAGPRAGGPDVSATRLQLLRDLPASGARYGALVGTFPPDRVPAMPPDRSHGCGGASRSPFATRGRPNLRSRAEALPQCPTTTTCVALAGSAESVRLDGEVWSAPAPVEGVGHLAAPSVLTCVRTMWCATFDSSGRVLTYDGQRWSRPVQVDCSPMSPAHRGRAVSPSTEEVAT